MPVRAQSCTFCAEALQRKASDELRRRRTSRNCDQLARNRSTSGHFYKPGKTKRRRVSHATALVWHPFGTPLAPLWHSLGTRLALAWHSFGARLLLRRLTARRAERIRTDTQCSNRSRLDSA